MSLLDDLSTQWLLVSSASCFQAGAVDPAELAMYAALMTSNSNIQMVEYLMAGMWILLKHPSNRQVLGGAFQVNPAASKLTKNMISKLHDTIDVADVNETVSITASNPGQVGCCS